MRIRKLWLPFLMPKRKRDERIKKECDDLYENVRRENQQLEEEQRRKNLESLEW